MLVGAAVVLRNDVSSSVGVVAAAEVDFAPALLALERLAYVGVGVAVGSW